MLHKLKKLREANEEGFTLIELLVVIVIIGILAAIALPIFMNQQKEAAFASVKSDVKNMSTIAMTQKTKTGKYPMTCDEWKSVVPQGWSSDSTVLLRVKTSTDGTALWVEAQPGTLNAADPADVKAGYTAVYNSNKGDGVTTRAAYSTKYSVPANTSLSTHAGITGPAFTITGSTTDCATW